MDTIERETRINGRPNSMVWLAAATGATAGVALLAYGSRKQSRWDQARTRVSVAASDAQEQLAEHWMPATLGTAALGMGLWAIAARRGQTSWNRAKKRAATTGKQIAVTGDRVVKGCKALYEQNRDTVERAVAACKIGVKLLPLFAGAGVAAKRRRQW
jgi:hypothetical protein